MFAMDLHPLEVKVIKGLEKVGGSGSAQAVAKAAGIEKIQAERFGYSLSQKDLVTLKKTSETVVTLTPLAKKCLEGGLPEKKALLALKEKKGPLAEVMERANVPMNAISAVLGILKKNAYIAAMPSDKGLELEITTLGEELLAKGIPAEAALKDLSAGKEVGDAQLIEFKNRGFVKIDSKPMYTLTLKAGAKNIKTGETTAHQLTHKMLKTGAWRDKKFRGYDIKSEVPAVYGGRLHPLTIATNKIRRIYLEMGFEEADGPLVESSFWNFDALFQPQDHPCRDLADTFYLENPKECKLPDKKIVEPKVKLVLTPEAMISMSEAIQRNVQKFQEKLEED